MAARIACILFLLEEAHREDILRRRRQGRLIRGLSTNSNFVDTYRLTEDLIVQLEKDILPLLPKEKRQGGISNRIKVLCALSFLASGSHQRLLGKNEKNYVSQSSASRAIQVVVNALSHPSVVKKHLLFPQNAQERQILKDKFYNKFGVPGVIGCIDGSLVSMVQPKQDHERFFCRKGYHARKVMIINDPDLNIMYVDVRYGPATSDSRIFESSLVKPHLEKLISTGETAFLLGDSAYNLKPYMMVPCKDAVPGSPEDYYNKLHSKARCTAERTYGVLKGRFRCLLVHRVLHYDPEMVVKIVIACCVLHNICIRAGLPPVELPARLQKAEEQVLRLLKSNKKRPPHDLQIGLPRDRLINQLWSAR